MSHSYLGRIEGIELENYRSISAKRVALEENPRAFTQEQSIEVMLDWYKTLGFIDQNHPEFESDQFPQLQVFPETGQVYGIDEIQ